MKHSFGGVEVQDDPLAHGDRLSRHAERLRIETVIEDDFLRCPCDTAEIGVHRDGFRVVNGNLRPLRGLCERRALGFDSQLAERKAQAGGHEDGYEVAQLRGFSLSAKRVNWDRSDQGFAPSEAGATYWRKFSMISC